MLVQPVAKENLSAQLYAQLRRALMDGQLSPGERLTRFVSLQIVPQPAVTE